MWVLSCSSHHAFTLPPWTLPSGAIHPVKCFLLQAPLVMVFCHSKRKVIKTAPAPWRRGGEWIYPASEIITCQWQTSSLRGEEIGVIHDGAGVLRDNEKPHCDSNTDPKSVLRDWVGTFLWKGLSLNLLCSQKWPWTSYPPAKCQSCRCASGLAYTVLGTELKPSCKQRSNWATSVFLTGRLLEPGENGPPQLKFPQEGRGPMLAPGDCCVSSERMTVRILEGMLVMISWEMRKEEEMPNPLMC